MHHHANFQAAIRGCTTSWDSPAMCMLDGKLQDYHGGTPPQHRPYFVKTGNEVHPKQGKAHMAMLGYQWLMRG